MQFINPMMQQLKANFCCHCHCHHFLQNYEEFEEHVYCCIGNQFDRQVSRISQSIQNCHKATEAVRGTAPSSPQERKEEVEAWTKDVKK